MAEENTQSFGPGKSSGRIWATGAAIVIGALIVTLLIGGHMLSPLVKDRIIATLRATYESDVKLRQLRISVFPSVHVEGEGLVLSYHGRTDLPPLISITRFSGDAGWLGLVRSTTRVDRLRLQGLQIHVPPRDGRSVQDRIKPHVPRFVIAEVDADGTLLEILPKKPGKDALRFDIRRLKLWGAGKADNPMSFQATLINAKPVGEIRSEGQFGPWEKDALSLTPLAGRYTFEHADLSVFHGISGILSSQGNYHGVLEAIQIIGTTDTPDFKLDVSGNPVHLKTQFQAAVDGTDGDTKLEPVKAQFGNSSVVAYGTIERKGHEPGKTITLDVSVAEGRLEDMLRLGVKSSRPAMTGAIAFHTRLLLPPGELDVAEKLDLDGRFISGATHFTKPDVQHKLNELSNRARGNPENGDLGRVSSNFRGSFTLQNGLMRFRNLAFSMPGAEIRLNGTYSLRSGELDFHGTAALQAKLSETTTGIKSFLLKAVDPFFRKKKAGAVIPIRITGTKDSPSFGLNLGGKG
jgi:hypothetical protein